jgi:alpha-mannosidase
VIDAGTALTFTAAEVPGLGWKTFYLAPRPAAETPPARLPALARLLLPLSKLPLVQKLVAGPHRARPPYRIENEFLLAEVEKDGTLTVTDKRSGEVYRGLNRFVDGGDCGDEYNFCPPAADRLTAPRLKDVSLTRGPVRQTLTLRLELPAPVSLTSNRTARAKETVLLPITSTITLTQGVPRLDIHTEVENRARDHRLRVHFPAPFAVEKAEHDGHFEIVERRVGVPPYDETWVEQPRPEVPQRAFTSLSNGRQRLTVANRGLPEVEVLRNEAGNSEIALTLLRCVGWLSRDDFPARKGHAGPFLETPGAQMIGKWAFDYAVILTDEASAAYQQAWGFETPLRAVLTDVHSGPLPSQGSFVSLSPAEFRVSAVKAAEDGRGWLIRGYNWSNRQITLSVRPWQAFRHIEQVNLAEEKVATLRAAKDGTLQMLLRPHGIETILYS